ncbi:MAG: NUDIX domain-containing protein [Candidatus Krumholzibacteria bacterium]|nr:NUDIX domain-containing protein [Candidatus Krumholzibacteria bacterium]
MKERWQYCPFCGRELSKMMDEGRERIFCVPEKRFIYDNPVPASTAVVFDDKGRILLVLRNREPGSGRWALPGGFIEIGESPAAAAARELEEETGVRGCDPVLVDVIHEESEFYGTSLVITGYRFEKSSGAPVAGDDADDAAFFELDALPPLAFRSHELLIRKSLRQGS